MVEPETFALVQRLSDLGGESVSSIIRELLESARPVLEHLVAAAEAYQAADASKQADMRAALEAAESRLLPEAQRIHDESLQAFDDVAGQ
jgi:hypothetical protein